MNYDHRYHAGNFADVLKHVVLCRVLLYLARKPAPFRVIDTHAGRGTYGLKNDAAGRTQEWRSGVGRLDRSRLSPAAAEIVAPYLDAVAAAVSGDAPYPGSPVLAQRLTRSNDRLVFCELHPAAVATLRAAVGQDRRAKVVHIDGYVGLNAFVPPVERRGLVLIDPPFEAVDEFDRLATALIAAHAKWREGVLMAWYPVKDERAATRLWRCLARAVGVDMILFELALERPSPDAPLAASGVVIVNPPYTLEAEMTCLLPELLRQLGAGRGKIRIERHAGGAKAATT